MILGCVSVSARSVAQNQRVSLNLRNCTVMQLFEEIQQQTRLFFFYDQKHFQGQNVLTVRADDEEVGGLLKRLFADKNVEFVFEDQTVIVRPAVSRKQVNGKVVKGVVRDAAGHVLPGVTVVLKGTTLGTSTDIDGKYSLTLPVGEHVLVFSITPLLRMALLMPREKMSRTCWRIIVFSRGCTSRYHTASLLEKKLRLYCA